jgi:hypothetical protein
MIGGDLPCPSYPVVGCTDLPHDLVTLEATVIDVRSDDELVASGFRAQASLPASSTATPATSC